ncbi:hypothetical protein QYM36_002229, partial [Artemia franciscana]
KHIRGTTEKGEIDYLKRFRQMARAALFAQRMFMKAYNNRTRAMILYATETGKSFGCAKQLAHIFLKAFKPETGQFVVTTDASTKGIGAILSQIINGEEQVIAYASRTLTPGENKLGYQTIEWEFNSYVLHNPLNYLSHEPAGGPGYEIIPEDWKPPTYRMNKPVKSRENKDHCRECRCRDITQPDELIEAGNIWFDKKNFRLIKSLVEEEFERNQQIIKKDGFFSAVHMLAKVKSAVHMIAEVKLSYTALARV